jgi:hypothetical protein
MQSAFFFFLPVFRPALLLSAALLFCLLFAAQSLAATLPQAASAVGREMDRQVVSRMGQPQAGAENISLCVTTPVDNNTLESSNPLARQMQEEIARWFVQAGYTVQEIRKGADLLFEPGTGEMLLTRKDRLLASRNVTSLAIVAGTYTVTPKNVRFNIRLVRTKNREILAMSTVTVPMNREVAALVHNGGAIGPAGFTGTPIEPTVVTLLP